MVYVRAFFLSPDEEKKLNWSRRFRNKIGPETEKSGSDWVPPRCTRIAPPMTTWLTNQAAANDIARRELAAFISSKRRPSCQLVLTARATASLVVTAPIPFLKPPWAVLGDDDDGFSLLGLFLPSFPQNEALIRVAVP